MRVVFNLVQFEQALDSIFANKLRSALTSLGVVFGVASVIAMFAIGKGSEKELMAQFELVGTNNIIIKPSNDLVNEGGMSNESYSPGLSIEDIQNISKVIPTVYKTSPEILWEPRGENFGRKGSEKLIGVNTDYFSIMNLKLNSGRYFSEQELLLGDPVGIIGGRLRNRFFVRKSPIGKRIKIGDRWITIIGVLKEKNFTEDNSKILGVRNSNDVVYVPVKTLLNRFENKLTSFAINTALDDSRGENDDDRTMCIPQLVQKHQIDKIIVQVDDSDMVYLTADVISRMLKRRHNGVIDFELIIPEQVLQQKQRSKRVFNIVLGSIAGISLLVGGIGIMNIMIASVMERIQEIGIRISVGAKRTDILFQFLLEAILISLVGGIFGIALGSLTAKLITNLSDLPTLITPASIFTSFFVALVTGLIFGISPAIMATKQDPIVSLRYE